jgi:hypothetical protein
VSELKSTTVIQEEYAAADPIYVAKTQVVSSQSPRTVEYLPIYRPLSGTIHIAA